MGKTDGEASVVNIIPRTLHQVWIGREAPNSIARNVDEWDSLESWKHILWDEELIDALPWLGGTRNLYDAYYHEKCFNGAVNVARVEILKTFGGVYLDCDIQFVQDFSQEWWMKTPTGMWLSESPHVKGRPQNAAMAAIKDHRILLDYERRLAGVGSNAVHRHPSWKKSGSGILIDSLRRFPADYQMIPCYTFHPHDMHGRPVPGIDEWYEKGGRIFGRHEFFTTNEKRNGNG